MSDPHLVELRLDAVLPPEMAEKAEVAGVKKAGLSVATTFILAVLAVFLCSIDVSGSPFFLLRGV